MGNWRRVHIMGTCNKKDLESLRKALDPGKDYDNFHCLVCGGLAGLPNWAEENIDVIGNLAERDYNIQDVADQLKLLGGIAPSLIVDIHCGGDYEDEKCIKTVRLHKSGKVEILSPQIDNIATINDKQIKQQLLKEIFPKKLTIYQCQSIAKKGDNKNLEFYLVGPKARMKAKWIDVYMGIFQIEGQEEAYMVKQFEFANDIYCEF